MALRSASSELGLVVPTKSIDHTLSPLIEQITNLVSISSNLRSTDSSLQTLSRLGRCVHSAVEQFVAVGENIAKENREIREEVNEACILARSAGSLIQQQTCLSNNQYYQQTRQAPPHDGESLVRASRQLLSSITRVLLLADKVIVTQILQSRNKVLECLLVLENSTQFTDFMQIFGEFGNSMAQLGKLTGDRQQDLKDNRLRCELACVRAILEKTTMMVLSSAKLALRHSECPHSIELRAQVLNMTRKSLLQLDGILCPATEMNADPVKKSYNGATLSNQLTEENMPLWKLLRPVQLNQLCLRSGPASLNNGTNQDLHKMNVSLPIISSILLESAETFTNSRFVESKDREFIRSRCLMLRQELIAYYRHERGYNTSHQQLSSLSHKSNTLSSRITDIARDIHDKLYSITRQFASDIIAMKDNHKILQSMKFISSVSTSQASTFEKSGDSLQKFRDHMAAMITVCRFLDEISCSEELSAVCQLTEKYIKQLGEMVLLSYRVLSIYPSSGIALDCMEVFGEAWLCIMSDIQGLLSDISVWRSHCGELTDCQNGAPGSSSSNSSQSCLMTAYSSLPRAGESDSMRYGNNQRISRKDMPDQNRLTKTGMEMKMLVSEIDSEAAKWSEPNNDVIRRAKTLSKLSYSMCLFASGQGPLRTTQDLFLQCEYFATQGRKLHSTIIEFLQRIPHCPMRSELVSKLDNLLGQITQLENILSQQIVGRLSTFSKADNIIQLTKLIMSSVTKLVTQCFLCNSKFGLDYRQRSQPSPLPFSMTKQLSEDQLHSSYETNSAPYSPNSYTQSHPQSYSANQYHLHTSSQITNQNHPLTRSRSSGPVTNLPASRMFGHRSLFSPMSLS